MRYTKSDYTLKISNASPAELLIINYELLIDNLDGALLNVDSPDYISYVNKAQALLNELIYGLDMKFELARQLFSIYVYVNKLLLDACSPQKANELEESKKILEHLLDGWRQIENAGDNESKDTLFENTQQIYAGLTYGKNGQLNEYADDSKERGYKA